MAVPSGCVRPDWTVRPAVVVASGPSFNDAQAAEIGAARAADRVRVIAVNDNWRRVPAADLVYACDGRWVRHNRPAIVAAGFAGEQWTQDEGAARAFGLCRVRHVRRPGLTRTACTVHGGGNSGYQAINLAYLFGARRIVLVGFDMQPTGGELHWFGRHPTPEMDRRMPFAHWLGQFADLARDLAAEGVDTINATRETALRCFRRATFAEAIE